MFDRNFVHHRGESLLTESDEHYLDELYKVLRVYRLDELYRRRLGENGINAYVYKALSFIV